MCWWCAMAFYDVTHTWNWLCFLLSLAALSFPLSSFLSLSLFFPSFLPSFFPSFPSLPSLSLVFFSFSFFCFFSFGGGFGFGGLPLQHALSRKVKNKLFLDYNINWMIMFNAYEIWINIPWSKKQKTYNKNNMLMPYR